MDTNTLIAAIVGMVLFAGLVIYMFRRFNTAEADIQVGPHVRAKIRASKPQLVGTDAAPDGTFDPVPAIDVSDVDAGGNIKVHAEGNIAAEKLTAAEDVEITATRPKD